jgi:hypothetical protein
MNYRYLNRQKKTPVEWFVLLMFILVPLLIVGGGFIRLFGNGPIISSGFRDGEIQKFSHRGLFLKTYEGELALAGAKFKQGTSNVSGNVFEFSVLKQEIVNELLELPAGQRVRLHYNQHLWLGWLSGDTQYSIVKIELLKQQ